MSIGVLALFFLVMSLLGLGCAATEFVRRRLNRDTSWLVTIAGFVFCAIGLGGSLVIQAIH